MKIFLSWSGERSKEVAQAFHEWLPSVLQAAKTWFSPEDIKVGKSWRDTVVSALEDNNRGLLFLTHENASAAWVMFEAGALSKNIEDSSVCPVLCGITTTDLIGPLSAFQAIRVIERDDVWKLIKDYNGHLGDLRLEESVLKLSFNRAWPELDNKIKEILGRETPKTTRNTQDIAEETLDIVRQIQQELDNKNKSRNSHSAIKCREAYNIVKLVRRWSEELSEENIDTIKPTLNHLASLLSDLHVDLGGEKLRILIPTHRQKSADDNSKKISNLDELTNNWSTVLDYFRANLGNTIVAYLHNASPLGVDEDNVILAFTKSFHHTKALDAMKRLPFEEKLNDLLDKPRRLKFILIEDEI
jgi:hypothetical protein